MVFRGYGRSGKMRLVAGLWITFFLYVFVLIPELSSRGFEDCEQHSEIGWVATDK